eukprot:586878_1
MASMTDRIVKEGYLFKKSKFVGVSRQRWAVLSDQYLKTYKAKRVYDNPTEVFDLMLYDTTEHHENGSVGFSLVSTTDNVMKRVFTVGNLDDLRDWVAKIRDAQYRYSMISQSRQSIIFEHWFRIVMNNGCMSIDNITQMIMDYYDQATPYHGKFILQNCGKGIEVVNESQVKCHSDQAGGEYVSAKLDTPMYTDSKAVFFWQIMMDCEEGSLGGFDMFGVVSDKCDNIGKCPWGGLIDAYGISATNYIWAGTTHSFNEDIKHKARIQRKQIVQMELDCVLSQLVFKRDGNVIYGPIELPQRKAWYPAITFGFPTWKLSATFIPVEI